MHQRWGTPNGHGELRPPEGRDWVLHSWQVNPSNGSEILVVWEQPTPKEIKADAEVDRETDELLRDLEKLQSRDITP